jgi:hypothetical protein
MPRGSLIAAEQAEPVRRRIARWVLRLFFLPLGLALIAFPFVLLVVKEDYALVDDTRAWLGAGIGVESDESVPVVIGVNCTKKKRSFRSIDRAGSWLGWDCSLSLAPVALRNGPKDDPFAGRSYDDGLAEWNRRLDLQLDALKLRSTMRGLERSLPTDRSSDDPASLPELRLLSPEDKVAGKPARLGVVWGGGELLLRWLAWLADSVLFFAIGGTLGYVAWRVPRHR